MISDKRWCMLVNYTNLQMDKTARDPFFDRKVWVMLLEQRINRTMTSLLQWISIFIVALIATTPITAGILQNLSNTDLIIYAMSIFILVVGVSYIMFLNFMGRELSVRSRYLRLQFKIISGRLSNPSMIASEYYSIAKTYEGLKMLD